MVTLMIGETGFFQKWYHAAPSSFTQLLANQFEHSVWRGLHFWDVILPAFMLIAGTAMALSYHKQQQLHYTWKQSFSKVLKRSFWLLFWGILIYSVRDQHLNFQLSNVLTQTGVHHRDRFPCYPEANVVAVDREFLLPSHP